MISSRLTTLRLPVQQCSSLTHQCLLSTSAILSKSWFQKVTDSLSSTPTKKIAFIEVKAGTDKGPDGFRPDTKPLVAAVNEHKGWSADVVWYEQEKSGEILKKLSSEYAGVMPRVNPGNVDEQAYFQFLTDLNKKIPVYETPTTLTRLGAKDALVELAGSPLVPKDTFGYKSVKDLKSKFPLTLKKGERVLKQNRGSTGEGIWRVVVDDQRKFESEGPLPEDTVIKCTEAKDNKVHKFKLGEFIEFCRKYIEKSNGGVVDMKFLPRIKEGEVRVLCVGEEPVFVVSKTPAKGADAFSATLFSGAKYVYEAPSKWPKLLTLLDSSMDIMRNRFEMKHVPLLWSVDFIRDNDKSGNDTYVLSEFNCSCIGFTSHLDQGIQQKVAKELIRRLNKE